MLESRKKLILHSILAQVALLLGTAQYRHFYLFPKVRAANAPLSNHKRKINNPKYGDIQHRRQPTRIRTLAAGILSNSFSSIIPRGGSTPHSSSVEKFQMNADFNPENINHISPSPECNDPQRSALGQELKSKILPSPIGDDTVKSFGARASFHRQITKADERAILGRAVLTTPHRRMPAILISADRPKTLYSSPTNNNPGPIFTATPVFVTKFSLCESLGCALRDLRVVDQFSTNGRYSGPAFLARSNCVIVNVGHVRAIVMRNQVLIFLPEVLGGIRRNHTTVGHHDAFVLEEKGRDPRDIANSISSYNIMDHAAHENHTGDLKPSNRIMETIELLVEALVTHLNSIYHTVPHVMFDQGEVDKGNDEANRIASVVRNAPKRQNHNNNRGEKSVGKKSAWTKQQRNTLFQKRKSSVESATTSQLRPPQLPPFELVVIESLLGHVCSYESSRVTKLIQRAKDVLGGITHNFNERKGEQTSRKKDAFIEMQAKLRELLPLKNKVDELEAKCAEVAGAIAEVLKNDEDMAAMRLSEINDDFVLDGDPNNLHVEVELLFEDYLLQMDEVLLSLRSVQSSVRNTEEVVEIELDLIRNRIMRYEMLLELSGLVVGVAAAVTGAFGMNLVNHFEDHATMFYNVCAVLFILMGGMGYGILRKLSNDNIL